MDLVPFEGHLRLLPPLFLTWLAWIVWRTPFQERSNRRLALFLAVVALGYWVELAWVLVRGYVAVDYVLRDVQNAAGLLDPPLLVAFALTFRATLSGPWRWALYAGYAVSGTYLWVQQLGEAYLVDPGLAFAQFVYINGSYLAALLVLVVTYMRESRSYLARQLGFLTVGVGFAALSRSHALFFASGPAWAYVADPFRQLLAGALLSGVILLLLSAALGLGRRRLRPPAPLLTATGALLVVFYGVLALMLVVQSGSRFTQFGSLFFGLRWTIFALVVGYGILRFQLFDFDLRVRQAVALLGTSVVAVAVAMVGGALAADAGFGLLAARLAGLAAAAAAFLLGYLTLDRGLRVVWPDADAPARYAVRRLEIYQATLEYAMEKPQWTDDERRFVDTLREVFEVTPEEHSRVVARLRRRPLG